MDTEWLRELWGEGKLLVLERETSGTSSPGVGVTSPAKAEFKSQRGVVHPLLPATRFLTIKLLQ